MPEEVPQPQVPVSNTTQPVQNTPLIQQPKSKNIILVVIGIIAVIILIALGGWYFLGQRGTENKTIEADNSSITLAPKDASSFTKSVSEEVSCGIPAVGVVSYEKKSDDSSDWSYFMKINNPKVNKDPYPNSNSFGVFNSFLGDDSIKKLDNVENIFIDYCGGHATIFAGNIKNLNYPGTDKTRSYYQIVGQEAGGDIEVVVIARTGDNYIKLSKVLPKTGAIKAAFEKCGLTSNYASYTDACAINNLIADKDVSATLKITAETLVNIFAIQ